MTPLRGMQIWCLQPRLVELFCYPLTIVERLQSLNLRVG